MRMSDWMSDVCSSDLGEARTLVVVPTMIGDVAGARPLVDALEVRFLANRDDNLRFALLTDFLDGDAQVLPGDASVLDEARRGIDALNARHAGGEDVFLDRKSTRLNSRH